MERIAPEAKTLQKPQLAPMILSSSTLFHTSFVFEDRFYQHVLLPPFWVEAFGSVAKLFSSHGWKYGNLKPLGHFTPIFIDKHLSPHPFGATRKALIIESDPKLFESEAQYLLSRYKKEDIYICAPKSSSLHVKIDFIYEKNEELLGLEPKDFRYALILGNFDRVERLLQSQESFKQPTLF
jgi:ferrochelatase